MGRARKRGVYVRYDIEAEPQEKDAWLAASKLEGFPTLNLWVRHHLNRAAGKYDKNTAESSSSFDDEDDLQWELDDLVETVARLKETLGKKAELFAELQVSNALGSDLNRPSRTKKQVNEIRNGIWKYVVEHNGAVYDKKEEKSITITRADLDVYSRFLRLLILKTKLVEEGDEISRLSSESRAAMRLARNKYLELTSPNLAAVKTKQMIADFQSTLARFGDSAVEKNTREAMEAKLKEIADRPVPLPSKTEIAEQISARMKATILNNGTPEEALVISQEILDFVSSLGESEEDRQALQIMRKLINTEFNVPKDSPLLKLIEQNNIKAKIG